MPVDVYWRQQMLFCRPSAHALSMHAAALSDTLAHQAASAAAGQRRPGPSAAQAQLLDVQLAQAHAEIAGGESASWPLLC